VRPCSWQVPAGAGKTAYGERRILGSLSGWAR
jgi:hypothetical protein